MTKKKDFYQLFLYLCLFNGLFFLFQLIFIFKNSLLFLFTMSLPGMVYFENVINFLIHLSLYIGLSFIQALITQNLPFTNKDKSMVWIWGLTIAAILSANAWFFPLSKFSQLFSPLPPAFMLSVMLISLTGLGLATAYVLYKNKIIAVITITGCSVLFLLNMPGEKPLALQQAYEKPNVIFIGIDSLTPSNITASKMPRLYQMLKQATVFSETISPLARTYPAWISILTGLHPQHHHARYNLIPSEQVNKEHNLVDNLSAQGYQTFYATDERRFNNIDKDFGFDQVVGPRIGVNDMLIGNFNDFPLINLVVNFRISRWLFPYNYQNRGAYYHYYPQTFNNEIEKELLASKPSPIFITVHFTLPHWPYSSAQTVAGEHIDPFDLHGKQVLYQDALSRVDEQVFQLYHFLETHGYLKNAIVVLLSDHGETLFTPNSRPLSMANYQGTHSRFAEYIKRKTDMPLNTSGGHGSDLLSSDQFHCLLAFKIFHNQQPINKPEKLKQRVSLLDIRPTIEDFIQAENQTHLDGISLKPMILGKKQQIASRDFYLESGMLPNLFPTQEQAQEIARQLFKVNSKGRLKLQSKKLNYLDKLKLYAILSGNWLFATYPDEEKHIQVLLDLNSKRWSDDPDSELFKEAGVNKLYKKLSSFLPVGTIPQAKNS